MVNPNRIEEYRFNTTELVADASKFIDVFTTQPLNGYLLAVQLLGNNFATAGSLYLNVSGTEEVIWNLNGASVSGTYYPRGQARLTDGTLTSGTNLHLDRIALNSVLHLTGSNLTASKSGLGINIVYAK